MKPVVAVIQKENSNPSKGFSTKVLLNTIRTNKFNTISEAKLRGESPVILPNINLKAVNETKEKLRKSTNNLTVNNSALLSSSSSSFILRRNNNSTIKILKSCNKLENQSLIQNRYEKSPSPTRQINKYTNSVIKEENASKSPSRDELPKRIDLKQRLTSLNKEKLFYYVVMPGNNSELIKKCMEHRTNWREVPCSKVTTLFHFKWQHISTGIDFSNISKIPSVSQFVNHLEFHSTITNKLNLFINIMKFCESRNLEVFKFIPFTVIIQYDSPSFLSQFEKFSDIFNKIAEKKIDGEMKYASVFKMGMHNSKLGLKTSIILPPTHYDGRNMWLVKATDLNRGRCIKIGDSIAEIKIIIKMFYEGIFKDFKSSEKDKETIPIPVKKENSKSSASSPSRNIMKNFDYKKYRTSCMLLQKYIEKPLTYKGRKFDVRIWVLYTHRDQVYAFKEGHLKTSSLNYDVNNTDNFIHLTNYSVQKYNKEFSKYEIGNEVSFSDFQIFLDKEYGSKGNPIDVRTDIFPKFKKLIKLAFHSAKDKINWNQRKYCFELFGFDFIIDKNLDVCLLEVNTNPGLEESSPLIKNLLPRMVDDMLRLTIDNVFETKYSWDLENTDYCYNSPYFVDGHLQSENLWELVTDFCDFYENDY